MKRPKTENSTFNPNKNVRPQTASSKKYIDPFQI
jgi:hypothetical protein